MRKCINEKMTRIGLLSDTHGLLDRRIFEHFKDVDEIWHSGDIGSAEVLQALREFKPTRAFRVEEVNVLMTHIGGYPGKYNPWLIPWFRKSLEAKQQQTNDVIDLFVCGHSHILKVQYDNQFKFLTMNPGAAGKQGWQPCQTLLRFTIDGAKIDNLEVIELERL